jgi:enamine deaminase RidA (YjgF/YER057c/UK114 family)
MEDGERELTARQRYWLKHIQACEAAGMSLKAYASANGFTAGAIYAAKKVLIRKGLLPQSSSRFQRVHAPAPSVGSEWRVELPNGTVVGFSGAVDGAALSAVLNAVAGLA